MLKEEKKVKRKTLLKIGTALVAVTTAMYAFNKFVEKTALKKQLLSHNEKMYFDWKLGRICYDVCGVGSPVLLIHDSIPCSSMHEWSKIKRTLAKEHTVFCIDLLGCGNSDHPKMTYTSYVYVQLITDFIEKVIKQKTDVVTNGLSGAHALMACRNDANIGKLIMINPKDLAVLAQVPNKISKLTKTIIQIPLIGTFIYNIIHEKTNLEMMFAEKYIYNPLTIDDDMVDTYYECAHMDESNGKYLYASLKGKYLYMNIAPSLKAVSNPIHIIEGNYQPHSEESLELYTSLGKEVSYEVFSETCFLPHLECPNAISERILEQLK